MLLHKGPYYHGSDFLTEPWEHVLDEVEASMHMIHSTMCMQNPPMFHERDEV